MVVLSAVLFQEADSAPPPGGGLRIAGWATASIAWATGAHDGVIAGRMYGRRQARVVLNVVDVSLERAPAPDRWGVGFRIEPIAGSNAAVVRAAGLNLGRDADLWQAYVAINLPSGRRSTLEFKAGKMATLMGVEGFEDFRNPAFDVGPQDIFLEPFSETGVQFQIKSGLEAQLRVSQGWDRVTDNNSGKTVTVRIALSPEAPTSIALLGYTGPEQDRTTARKRSGAELIVSRRISPRVGSWLQLDYGQENRLGSPSAVATWHAAGLWLTYGLSRSAGIGFRGDYVCDCDGARTSSGLGFPFHTGQRLIGLTATLNLRRGAHLLFRPELRYDRATLPVFAGRSWQLTGAMAASYIL